LSVSFLIGLELLQQFKIKNKIKRRIVMKSKSRIISILLVAFFVISLLTGCQGKSQDTGSTGTTGQTTQTTTTSETKAEEPREPKVLRIGIAAIGRPERPEGSNSGEYIDDNWSTDYIKENFGKPNNIEIKFELIDDTADSSLQNYQLLMAAKKAPDLFYVTVGNISFVANLAANGALADLQPSIDKHGENLKKFLGEDFIKTYGTFYGYQYAIPGLEEIPAISHYWIRQDWLDALGLSMPTNFDDWYSVMKAFKARANELQAAGLIKNAKDVVPYAMYHTRYFTDWERIVTRFYPTKYFDPKNEEYYIYSGYGIEYMKEGFKEGMQFMNQMYREGLISPNFALDADKKTFIRDIVNGNAGSYCDNLFNGWTSETIKEPEPDNWQGLLRLNIPQAKYEWCHPWTNKYDGVIRNPLDSTVLTYAFVPVYSKVVDEAIMYLDFVSIPENMINIQYGEKDVTYTMDPVLGPMLKDEAALKAWGHGRGGRELIMIGRLPDRKWSRIQRSGARTAEEAEYAERIHKGIEENGYVRFPIEISGVPEKATYGGALRTPWEKFVASLIMAKPGEFESAWENGIKELEATGSTILIEANRKQVKLLGLVP